MHTHCTKKVTVFSLAIGLLLSVLNPNSTIASSPNQIGTVVQLLETKGLESANSLDSFVDLGNHIIAEFTGCSNLNNSAQLESVLTDAAHAANATVVGVKVHQFEPCGMTGVIILEESHISVHTWPEYGYASIDVYTCGDMPIEKALEVLREFFQPKKIRAITVNRGFEA